MTNEFNNLRSRRHDLSDMLKLQQLFLYSIYHQRAGKTSLFHMRGVDFTYFKTCCIPLMVKSSTGLEGRSRCRVALLSKVTDVKDGRQ